MCRFAGYIGNEYMVLSDLLDKSNNSLIKQSFDAKEAIQTINGDGCGIAWYNHNVDDQPAVYKSINPAWNDYNLLNIISKVRSKCFLGHVRASTIGGVTLPNCHPFTYESLTLTHNGTIRGFNSIRKGVINLIDNDIINNAKGVTDSEYFFALIIQNLRNSKVNLEKLTTEQLCQAITQAMNIVIALQKKVDPTLAAIINLIVTNGKLMVTSRYSNSAEDSRTLYYSQRDKGVVVASEPLDPSYAWTELPMNQFLIVKDSNQPIVTKAINTNS